MDADADEPLLGRRGNVDEGTSLSPEVSPTSSEYNAAAVRNPHGVSPTTSEYNAAAVRNPLSATSSEYNAAAVRNPEGVSPTSSEYNAAAVRNPEGVSPTSSEYNAAAVRNPEGVVLQCSPQSFQNLKGDPSQSNVFSKEIEEENEDIEAKNPTGSEPAQGEHKTPNRDGDRDVESSSQTVPPADTPSPPPSVLVLLKQTFKTQNLILALSIFTYFFIGVTVFLSRGHDFSGKETNSIVDGLYFSSVTLCTTGFGDIVPISSFSKGFTIMFAVLGLFIINLILELFDKQFRLLLEGIEDACTEYPINSFTVWIVDHENERMRISFKVGIAFIFVLIFNGMGTLTLFLVERLSWTDSFYGSMISSMTVGYGDVAFCTMVGRFFAFIWLLLTTIAVAEFFLILTEARQSMFRNQILDREITMEDLVAAHDVKLHRVEPGFVSCSEYVIYVLKELGDIKFSDVEDITSNFRKLNLDETGRAAVPSY